MVGQVDIFEAFPGQIDPPPMWECMKTCARANIHTDTFPNGGKRCMYGIVQAGTSGDDAYERINENHEVTIYCKFYQMKG